MAPIQNEITALPEGKTNDIIRPCMDTEECKMKNKVDNSSVQKGRDFSFPVTSFSVAEDENTHQEAIDVHDFVDGNVKMKDDECLISVLTDCPFLKNPFGPQITIDVRDFKDGDVTVRVVDDNKVVIEGNIEKQRDGSVSKKSFYRRFSFPGLYSEQNVFAFMSADGVLIITVPKEASSGKKENTTSSSHSDADKMKVKEVKVERISKSSEEKEEKHETYLEDEQDTKESAEESPDDSHCLLPICEEGLLFHDCFSEDLRKEFETAVDQMLEVFGDESTNENESSDENLESNNNAEETHFMALSEDQQNYKVVLDVRGYPSEAVSVRVEDKEVVVEGSVETEVDSFRSTKSFCRRFNFPVEVDLKALSSAVSPDGVLTITAPRLCRPRKRKMKSSDDKNGAPVIA